MSRVLSCVWREWFLTSGRETCQSNGFTWMWLSRDAANMIDTWHCSFPHTPAQQHTHLTPNQSFLSSKTRSCIQIHWTKPEESKYTVVPENTCFSYFQTFSWTDSYNVKDAWKSKHLEKQPSLDRKQNVRLPSYKLPTNLQKQNGNKMPRDYICEIFVCWWIKRQVNALKVPECHLK